MSTDRIGDWIQTYSGKQYWPLDPRPADVTIIDIAHALSMTCRFAGHCNRFYSVAEHSVHVSGLVPADDALVALFHDAPEAYIHDITRPLKRNLDGYHAIERRNWTAIAASFRLPEALPQSVHDADMSMLFAERGQLFDQPPPAPWGMTDPGLARDVVIGAWDPMWAKQEFMMRAVSLMLRRAKKEEQACA